MILHLGFSMNFELISRQLASVAAAQRAMGPHSPAFNPRPKGVLQDGGAAKDVLSLLQAHPGRFFTFGQIATHTKRTQKALEWACIFLRSLGHVEVVRDDGRNSRYMRYRVVSISKELD